MPICRRGAVRRGVPHDDPVEVGRVVIRVGEPVVLAPACNGSEIVIVATVLKSPVGVNVSVCGAASDRLPGRAAESHLSAGLGCVIVRAHGGRPARRHRLARAQRLGTHGDRRVRRRRWLLDDFRSHRARQVPLIIQKLLTAPDPGRALAEILTDDGHVYLTRHPGPAGSIHRLTVNCTHRTHALRLLGVRVVAAEVTISSLGCDRQAILVLRWPPGHVGSGTRAS
jgi:hypothetical protein